MPAAAAGGQGGPARAGLGVYDGGAALAAAAAALVAIEAQQAVERSGRFTLALSGGATPKATYHALAREPFARSVPWAATHIFWGDERCVSADDARSNERMAREALLDHVPVPPEHVHPMRCGEPGLEELGPAGEPGRAAERYERLLRATFPGVAASGGDPRPVLPGLDLILLGLGEDGHTASLFPGSPAAAEQQRWVTVSFPTDPSSAGLGRDVWRVTLTAPFINRTTLVIFLVEGTSKAEIMREVIESADAAGTSLPARLIHPASGRLLWLLDRDAAALLTGDEGLIPAAPRAGENSQRPGSTSGAAGWAAPGEVRS